jgi:hypothetical protein
VTTNSTDTYRYGQAPEHLATRRQLRTAGLSEAGLPPAGWLYLMRYHQHCPLYDMRHARPIRPLTPRQRQALAAGRALVGTEPCALCGTRVHDVMTNVCKACRQKYEPAGGSLPWPPDQDPWYAADCPTNGHDWAPWIACRMTFAVGPGWHRATIRRCRACFTEQTRPEQA